MVPWLPQGECRKLQSTIFDFATGKRETPRDHETPIKIVIEKVSDITGAERLVLHAYFKTKNGLEVMKIFRQGNLYDFFRVIYTCK